MDTKTTYKAYRDALTAEINELRARATRLEKLRADSDREHDWLEERAETAAQAIRRDISQMAESARNVSDRLAQRPGMPIGDAVEEALREIGAPADKDEVHAKIREMALIVRGRADQGDVGWALSHYSGKGRFRRVGTDSPARYVITKSAGANSNLALGA